jgi:hypothetical protein
VPDRGSQISAAGAEGVSEGALLLLAASIPLRRLLDSGLGFRLCFCY